MSPSHRRSIPSRAAAGLLSALLATMGGGCGDEEATPPAPADGRTDGGRVPGAGEGSTTDPRPPDPADDTPGASAGLVELAVPDTVESRTDELADDAWTIALPDPLCDGRTGDTVRARGYRLVNAGATRASVRVGLRGAGNGGRFSLQDGLLLAYDAGALPTDVAHCSATGASTGSFTSELARLEVPARGSVEFVVAALGPDDGGTYQLSLARLADFDDPPVGGDDPPADDPGPVDDPADYGPGCQDTCEYAGDGECDDGGVGSDFAVCALGTDCTDCGARDVSGADGESLCSNTCSDAGDGYCDDGGPGSDFALCSLGTDCADCGPRVVSGLCDDSCLFADDGWCDDEGFAALCDLGTDCSDCGPR